MVIEEITENQSILFENLEQQNKKLREKLDQQSQQMDQQSQQIDQIEQLMMSNTKYGKGTPKYYFEQLKEKEGQKKQTVPSDPDDRESSAENNSGDDEPIDNNDKERNSKDARSNIKEKRHKSTSKTRKHKDKWIRDPAQRLDSFLKVNTRFGGKQGEDVLAWFARLENNFEILEIKYKCRTPFAIALLTDGAEDCYNNWKKLFPDLQKSWTEFKSMMIDTYKHVEYDTLLLNDLFNARTQNGNFDGYVAKFEKFRSLVSLSADDFLRIIFTLGLPKRIKDQLVHKRPVSFDEAKKLAMNCWQIKQTGG